MKKFKFTIDGNEYKVHIQEIEGNIAKIEVNGSNYDVELHQEVKTKKTPTLVRPAISYTADEKVIRKSNSSGTKVTSPLPGTIFKIVGKEGDVVKEGDTVIILEAMKMENNVLAEKDGVISELKLREGDSVLQGDVLFVIS